MKVAMVTENHTRYMASLKLHKWQMETINSSFVAFEVTVETPILWNVTPCSQKKFSDLSEKIIAAIFRVYD
jgi:hypothetical protein